MGFFSFLFGSNDKKKQIRKTKLSEQKNKKIKKVHSQNPGTVIKKSVKVKNNAKKKNGGNKRQKVVNQEKTFSFTKLGESDFVLGLKTKGFVLKGIQNEQVVEIKVNKVLSELIKKVQMNISAAQYIAKGNRAVLSFGYVDPKTSSYMVATCQSIGDRVFSLASQQSLESVPVMVFLDDKTLGGFVGRQCISSHKLNLVGKQVKWQKVHEGLLCPRKGKFVCDNYPLEAVSAHLNPERDGVVLFYQSSYDFLGGRKIVLPVALISIDLKVVRNRSTEVPYWQAETERSELISGVLEKENGKSVVYLGHPGGAIARASILSAYHQITLPKSLYLERFDENPILEPVHHNTWEQYASFNPAAITIGEQVHVLYRAMGPHGLSTVGQAVTADGQTIHHRNHEPIYIPREEFEGCNQKPPKSKKRTSFLFASGGGWGGCEDPRVTIIDDAVYICYVAYNGRQAARLALSWISIDDFESGNWEKWTDPVLISPPMAPGRDYKSGALFPEKINGKYVVLSRLFPNIKIDFVDDLNQFHQKRWIYGQKSIDVRPGFWDSRKIGVGAPPIRTDDGWLMIYYATNDLDASKYHIGAMLLDLEDPSIVLHRTNTPILTPGAWYENAGKPGIAYPCGAVVKDGKLFVYYGGGDTVTCVASADFEAFMAALKSLGNFDVNLQPIVINNKKKSKPKSKRIKTKRK